MYISKATMAIICALMVAFIILTCHYSSIPLQDNTEQVETSEWANNAGDIVESTKADPVYFAKDREHLIDSLAKVYKTVPKKVVEYVIATTEGETDIRPEGNPTAGGYFSVDSNNNVCPPVPKNITQNFSSPYYKAHVQIGDSSYMHLQSFDTLTVLWKKVNEGTIFNRKHLIQLDVSTANPDTKVSGVKAYRIAEKPKRWAVGFSAGYGFQLSGKSIQPIPFAGLTVSKIFLRF